MAKILRFYLLLSLFILSALGGNGSTSSLSPCLTLVDGSGKELAYAHVHIPDLNITVTTDATGRVCLERVGAGSYAAEVHYPGFARTTVQLELKADGETRVEVVLSNYTLESVVLTGRSQATDARRAPQANVSIAGEVMRRQPATNLVEALSVLPGVSGVGTGPAVSKPVIRGLSYNRVVTISPSGLRQEGQQWGDEHGLEIDPYSVDRATVLKGPASLAFGSDAIGGVLHLQGAPLPSDGNQSGLLVADYQANGGLAGISARYARAFKGWVLAGQLSGRTARPYENAADGPVFNTSFSEIAGRFQIGMQRTWGYSTLTASFFEQRWGLPEGERDSATGKFLGLYNNAGVEEERIASDDDLNSYTPFFPKQRIRHNTLAWGTSAQLGRSRLLATVGYQLNQRQEFESVVEGDEEAALGWNLHTVNYDVKLQLPTFGGGWVPTVGVGGMWQKSLNTGVEEFLTPDYTLFDIGAFGVVERKWEQLTLSGGLRVDTRSISALGLDLDTLGAPVSSISDPAFGETKFAAFDRSFTAVTGSLGASYAVTPSFVIKANIARGYRAPNIAELAANGAHEGTLRYEYGNQDLKPEQSLQGDLGIEWRSDWVTVSAAAFYNHISNYIFVEKVLAQGGGDSIPDASEPNTLAYRFAQADQAYLFGGELGVALTPGPVPGLTLESAFSITRGRTLGKLGDADSTRYLPFIPAPRLRTELRYERSYTSGRVKSWFLTANYDYYFRQDEFLAAAGTELPNAAYGLLGASAGVTFADRRGKPWATLMVTAQNLTDEVYQNHLSRLRYAAINNATGRRGIFSPGTNVGVRLVVPL